jgi:hypothetical protein
MQQLADKPRATRYEMSAPMLYRRLGEPEWSPGQTVNISRSGVLFTAPPPVPPANTRLQFVLMLPSLGHPGRSRVQCEGQVVRRRDEDGGALAVAATIESYEFLGMGPEQTLEVGADAGSRR